MGVITKYAKCGNAQKQRDPQHLMGNSRSSEVLSTPDQPLIRSHNQRKTQHKRTVRNMMKTLIEFDGTNGGHK